MTENRQKQSIPQTKKIIALYAVILFLPFISFQVLAQDNENLITQYVESKGENIIVFNPSNIKQYWIAPSVSSSNGTINIFLDNTSSDVIKSIPLRIKLANVRMNQSCKVEIIHNDPEMSFSVLNDNLKELAHSTNEDDFIQYKVSSAVFNLESLNDFSFYLQFSSHKSAFQKVKRIILSFFHNKESSFLSTPGTLHVTKDLVQLRGAFEENNNLFAVTGKNTQLLSQKKIYVDDNTIRTSVRIKNIGTKPTNIYIGFKPYTQNNKLIQSRNYPYQNNNQILNLVSSKKDSNSIIVDTFPQWKKGCYVACKVDDNMLDVPNFNLLDGRITEVKQLENGLAEIVFDSPQNLEYPKGTKLRIHDGGGHFIYVNSKQLNPGEEDSFYSEIKLDNAFLQYSPKAFSKGVDYVIPIILSFSVDANDENTIQIIDYSIVY